MTNPFDYDDPAIQAGRRKTIRDVAAAEIAAFDAFERWARGRWRAFLGWLARRAQRWGAAWAAWRRWLALAARPKDAGVTAEIASVHTFLAATPVSPFRVLSIGALAALAASLVWGAVGWFVRVPLLKAEAAAATETAAAAETRAATAEAANQTLVQRAEAAEADAAALRQREAQTTTAANRVAAEAAQRRRTAEERRRQVARQQQEILDAPRPYDAPFDGAAWRLRRQAAAAGVPERAVPAVPAPAAADALAPGVLSDGPSRGPDPAAEPGPVEPG